MSKKTMGAKSPYRFWINQEEKIVSFHKDENTPILREISDENAFWQEVQQLVDAGFFVL